MWDASRVARVAVEHFAQRGFGFFLLPNIVHDRLVVELVDTHTQVSHSLRSGTMSQAVGRFAKE